MTPLCYRIGVRGQCKWAFIAGLALGFMIGLVCGGAR